MYRPCREATARSTPARLNTLLQPVEVPLRRDDDNRIARTETRSDEARDFVEEKVVALVELNQVGALVERVRTRCRCVGAES